MHDGFPPFTISGKSYRIYYRMSEETRRRQFHTHRRYIDFLYTVVQPALKSKIQNPKSQNAPHRPKIARVRLRYSSVYIRSKASGHTFKNPGPVSNSVPIVRFMWNMWHARPISRFLLSGHKLLAIISREIVRVRSH